jgi:superfamily II RNA helicase
MIKTLIDKLTSRRDKVDKISPDSEIVIDSLRRLAKNEDFLLFRAVLQSHFAKLARSITTADKSMVDHIRGEMYVLEQLYNMTSEDGVTALERSAMERYELNEVLSSQQKDNIY